MRWVRAERVPRCGEIAPGQVVSSKHNHCGEDHVLVSGPLTAVRSIRQRVWASEVLMRRSVSCHLEATVAPETDVVLSVAVAATAHRTEWLSVTASGTEHRASEIDGGHATRLHVVRGLRAGRLQVDYQATIEGRSVPATVEAADQVRYLRPSRYCEWDRLAGFARSEFAGLEGRALLDAVSSWVGTRVAYVSGSSRPIDGAVSTLLAQEGVCRDFAHLVIAILRARGIPARLVSVYAPGLDPMDFHAVAEACIDGEWLVVDATTLAPRAGLVRIATGRDAADTAFLSTLAGSLHLDDMAVTAVVEDGLPSDDIRSAATIR